MYGLNTAISIVGFLASLSSIVFAFLAFKRSERQEQKKEGKNEGLMLSNIDYIKECVEQIKINLSAIEDRYHNILERMAKVEQTLINKN